MNVTLSIDDEARDLASRRGTSVNQLIRDYLAELAADLSPEEMLGEPDELWGISSGDSGARGWTREELHERPGLR
jgi:hypothetical protein